MNLLLAWAGASSHLDGVVTDTGDNFRCNRPGFKLLIAQAADLSAQSYAFEKGAKCFT
jgi:hypothetical protein